MEDTRYQDKACSLIVEVPAGYGNDEAETDDLSGRALSGGEQRALVHREEIAEDRSRGEHVDGPTSRLPGPRRV